MSLEIDMIDVSNGDAIIVRYVGNDGRTEWVGLIDGGETESDGMKVVQHVRRYTMKEQIDDVICSHPDSDHIGGLPTVVRNIGVSPGLDTRSRPAHRHECRSLALAAQL
jgi:beta-lactamase superfamily II metal-dependent hydrolase